MQRLTVIRDETLAGSEEQVNLVAPRLDQLDCPSVCDALSGLAVDLHDLISNLKFKYSHSSQAQLPKFIISRG